MENQPRIYFDYNASAPLLSCARDAMVDALENDGNASSVHFEGREARKRVEQARRQLADLIGASPANVIFTSGATEAAMHALSPIMRGGGQEITASRLYVGETEHPCILAGGRFSSKQVSKIGVLESGVLDLDELTAVLGAHDFAKGLPLVSVQFANNETGIVQPVAAIAKIVHAHEGLLVVDAVQVLGKLPLSMADTGADFLILSSHKIGGPKGAGALVLANGRLSPMPFLTGGGQENFHRGGTENVSAIAGFGAACEWHSHNLTENIKKYSLRDLIENAISSILLGAGNGIAQPVFFGKSAERLGNTSCFTVPGVKAETALVALDLAGVSVSSGSACSSGKVKQSHVLAAMGANPQEIAGALRVSIGWDTTEEDASRFVDAWKTIIGRLAA